MKRETNDIFISGKSYYLIIIGIYLAVLLLEIILYIFHMFMLVLTQFLFLNLKFFGDNSFFISPGSSINNLKPFTDSAFCEVLFQ